MDKVMKQIKFSERLAAQAETRAKEVGVSFNEYVRHLVVNDITQNGYVEQATPEMIKSIEESRKDYLEGRYTTLRDREDIKKYFKKLLKSQNDKVRP